MTERETGCVDHPTAKTWRTELGERQEATYEAVWRLIDPNALVQMLNVRALLCDMEAQLARVPQSMEEFQLTGCRQS